MAYRAATVRNPNIRIAHKTLAAINAAIEADGGNRFRRHLVEVLPNIHDIYRQDEDKFRTHLGASEIGDECWRKSWYNFRWATWRKFDGRMTRLFNRGHMEEARLIALLLMIDVKVYQQDENGKQFMIKFAGGHGGGSGDGVGVDIPDLEPGVAALLEFKTHNDKSFKTLTECGVREAKFEHFVQMQTYMRKMGLAVALYCGSNKNDDHIHLELVLLDSAFADMRIDTAEKVIFSPDPPKKINESPGFYKCKWCDHWAMCQAQTKQPEINCRTCKASEPLPSGEWRCNMHNVTLTKEAQVRACADYRVRI